MKFPTYYKKLLHSYAANLHNLFIYHLVYLAIFAVLVFPFFWILLQVILGYNGIVAIENFSIVPFLLSLPGLMMMTVVFVAFAIFVAFTHYSTAIATSSRSLKEILPSTVIKEMIHHFFPLFTLGSLYALLYIGIVIGALFTLLQIVIIFTGESLQNLLGVTQTVSIIIFLSTTVLLGVSLYFFIRFSLIFHVFAYKCPTVGFTLAKSSSLIKNSYRPTLKIFLLTLAIIAIAFVITSLVASLTVTLLSLLEYIRVLSPAIKLILTFFGLTIGTLLWFAFIFFFSSFWMITTRAIYKRQKIQQEQIDPYPSPTPHIPFLGIYSYLSAGILLIGMLITLSIFLPFIKRELNNAHENVAITAHRGSSLRAPENTLSSVNLGIEENTQDIEIDVLHTKDGVVVVSHDNNLMRMADVDQNISDMSYSDLQKIDVGKKFSPEFEGEPVPKLSEVITAIMQNDRKLNIEIKEYGQEQIVEKVVNIIHETGCYDNCFITSLDYETLQQVRAIDPRIPIGIAVSVAIGDIQGIDVDIYSAANNLATTKFINKAFRQDREVMVWTLNDKKLIQGAIARGASNIITDDPIAAASAKEEYAQLSMIERLILSLQ